MVNGIASNRPLANGLPHWQMALYWWVGCLHWPITKMVGGLEQIEWGNEVTAEFDGAVPFSNSVVH
jgi:hypothetical protein